MTNSVLFFGAFLDALIGANIFFPGEPFLLGAGYGLYQGIYLGVVAVFLGGLLGDQISFFIGKYFGTKINKKLLYHFPKTKKTIAKSRLLMSKKGVFMFTFARLLGPVAWFVPFLAGSQNASWKKFSFFGTIGLILGVSQWVLWGYLLAAGVSFFPWWDEAKIFLSEHQNSLIVILLGFLVFVFSRYFKLKKAKLLTFAWILVGFTWLNYAHFFENSDNFTPQKQTKYLHLTSNDLKVYPGKSALYDAQGINVLFYGNSPKPLMEKLSWIENKTFSRNEIELLDYITLLKNSTPPISDLFWKNEPQHFAYQKKGTLSKRVHIRWWFGGLDKNTKEKIWLGAISYDDGLKLTLHAGVPTILHNIDPNIDKQRDDLAKEINTSNRWQTNLKHTDKKIVADEFNDYYSDGKLLVVKEKREKFYASL